MTDYRQELLPPEYRNLAINPGGEATSLGASYTATNGTVRTGVPAGGGVPAPVSGTGVVEYEVTAATSNSYTFGPLGPLEPVHRGAFKIPEAGEVSADGRFTVMEVECLGACGFPTVVQINEKYYENVKPGDAAGIVEGLRNMSEEVRS